MDTQNEFLDRLRTYFDLAPQAPAHFNASAADQIGRELFQLCQMVMKSTASVEDIEDSLMIERLVGQEPGTMNTWERDGYPLGEGARLIAEMLKSKHAIEV